MKNVFKAFGFVLLLSIISCNNKVIPLQHAYQDKPYQFATSSTKEQVWNKLIDLFTSKGLAIKTIDKNDGLMTTDNSTFLNLYTWENKDGGLTNPNALVVCSKVRGPFTFAASLKPDDITGQWTVRTKQESNRTLVDIRLANASGKVVVENSSAYGQVATRETHNLIVESTGVFEKSIEEALK